MRRYSSFINHLTAVAASIGALSVAGAVLLAWIFKSDTMLNWFAGDAVMVPNTAASIMLLALAAIVLDLIPARATWLVAVLAGAAALIAGLTLGEWVTRSDLGMGRLFVVPFTDRGQQVVGRMSPYTALTVTCFAVSLTILAWDDVRRPRWLALPAILLAICASVASTVGLGVMFEFRLPLASTLSTPTAITECLLILAIYSMVSDRAAAARLPWRTWATGPILLFILVTPVLIVVGITVGRDVDTPIDVARLGVITMAGVMGFAAIAGVAGHFAYVEHRRLLQVRRFNDRLRELRRTLNERVRHRTRELNRQRSLLKSFSAQLTTAERRNRKELATELHDNLAQLLIVARMSLQGADVNGDPAVMKRQMDDAVGVIDMSITYARTLISQMKPEVLTEQGLAPALQWLGGAIQGLRVDVERPLPDLATDSETADVLFTAVRELLMNVRRHAQVEEASLRAERVGDVCMLTIADRGVGFDPATLAHAKDLSHGLGLFGLAERLEVIGGRLNIDASPDGGARITITATLHPKVTTDHESDDHE